ncbi:MAG TPA: helix-turn-helix domain-containing protein [Solirubrobacteraceae bacterium]|jgi:AcrR family transcriptional regulator|nr:helix-turn-helix domain-containing protein [Solirubrobacteraceae bacterium]
MAPPRRHDTDAILDAARTIVLRDGPRAASVAAIAHESKAPVGTLYHRFASRDAILAATWLRALERFQIRALEAAEQDDPLAGAVAMGTAQISFARELPEDARLLLTLRRDDLLDADPDHSFRHSLDAINEPLAAVVSKLTKALCGRSSVRNREAVIRAVVDLPSAAVRRHLRDGEGLPTWLECDTGEAIRRLLQPGDTP